MTLPAGDIVTRSVTCCQDESANYRKEKTSKEASEPNRLSKEAQASKTISKLRVE
jgi:hypothetical protein